MDHKYTREKLELLLRDLDQYNAGEFLRQMSRIAEGATGQPGWECLTKQRDDLLSALEAVTYQRGDRFFVGMHGDADVTDEVGAAIMAVTSNTN